MAFTHLPLERSVLAGVVAYIVGLVTTAALTVGRTAAVLAVEIDGRYREPVPLGEILGTPPSDIAISGWLFYNAQFISTTVPSADSLGGVNRLTAVNLLREVGGIPLVLFLIVPLLLIGAGYAVVPVSETPGANGARNAGASIAAGYVACSLVGAFIFEASAANAAATASPAGIPTVFVSGGYALVFGAIGGLVADRHGYGSTENGVDW